MAEELQLFIDTAKAVIFASMQSAYHFAHEAREFGGRVVPLVHESFGFTREEVGAFSSHTTHGRGYLSLFCKERILN